MNEKKCCEELSSLLLPDLFKALSDPNRVAILASLAEKADERTVTDVATCCPVNISVVSRHLRTLREAGIVEAEKRGKEVYYRVRLKDLTALLRNLADALDACCPDGVCGTQGESK